MKGLDFALLEQNKAKAVLSKDDVDDLEAAFLEASSHSKPPVPKKRTREDMLQELKQKRAQQPGPQGATTNFKSPEDDTKMLEDAKQKGKFKPIGFKPIGSSTATKKKAISEGDGEKKKKKRKVDAGPDDKRVSGLREAMPPPPVPTPKETLEPVIPEELADDDFDIFADAGEYTGIEVGDDDDDDEKDSPAPKALESKQEGLEDGEEPSSLAPRRWIAADDELGPSRKPEVKPQSPQRDFNEDEDEDMEDDRPMRLAPLESSTLPSIRDLLEMDKAAGSYGKKKKRSDKKKAGSGGVADEGDGEDGPKKKSLEAKVDRDYKRSVSRSLGLSTSMLTQYFTGSNHTQKRNRLQVVGSLICPIIYDEFNSSNAS